MTGNERLRTVERITRMFLTSETVSLVTEILPELHGLILYDFIKPETCDDVPTIIFEAIQHAARHGIIMTAVPKTSMSGSTEYSILVNDIEYRRMHM